MLFSCSIGTSQQTATHPLLPAAVANTTAGLKPAASLSVTTPGTAAKAAVTGGQYQLPAYAPGGALNATNLTTDTTGNNLSIPGSAVVSSARYTLSGAQIIAGSTNLTLPSNLPAGLVSGTYPIFGMSLQAGTMANFNASANTLTLSKQAVASNTGNYTLVSPGSTLSLPQGLATGQFNTYLVDVVSRYGYEANAGLMIADCLNDASLPAGTMCDARSIVSLQSGGVINFGTGILEIGSLQTQSLILPDYGTGNLGTVATYMGGSPSYIPLSPAVATGSGSMPAGTYFYQIAYRTGEGRTLPSAEGSTTLSTSGSLMFTLPTCPQYAGDINIYISTASGGETLQGNGTCGGSVTLNNAALYLASEAVPTSAVPLPAIILHQNKSSLYSVGGGQSGFEFKLQPSFAASGMLATVGNGYSDVHNLFFYNSTANTSMQTVFYDVGAYALSVRRKLFVSAGSNQVGIKRVGQYNDVTWEDSNAVCASGASSNCIPLMDYATPMNQGDTESWHTNNWIGGLVGSKTGSTAPGVLIQGRSSAGQPAGASTISSSLEGDRFWGTSFETSTPGSVIQITDASNVSFTGVDITGTGVAGTSAIGYSYTGTNTSGAASACGLYISENSNVGGVSNLFTDQTDPTKSYTPSGGLLTTSYLGGFTYNNCSKKSIVAPRVIEQDPQQYDAGSPIATQSAITETATPEASATVATFAGTTVSGSNAITLSAPLSSPLAVGNYVTGSGVPSDASVSYIDTVNNIVYLSGNLTATNATAATYTAVTIANYASPALQVQSSFADMPAGTTYVKSAVVDWGAVATPISLTAPDSGSRWMLSPSLFLNLTSPMTYSSAYGPLNAGVAATDFGVYPVAAPIAGKNYPSGTLTFWNTNGLNYIPGCQFVAGETGSTPTATLTVGGVNCNTLAVTVPTAFKSVGSGLAANTDLAGVLTIAKGATASSSYTFSGVYASVPNCWAALRNTTASPLTVSQAQALNGILPTLSTTSLSFTVGTAPTTALSVPYACIAQN